MPKPATREAEADSSEIIEPDQKNMSDRESHNTKSSKSEATEVAVKQKEDDPKPRIVLTFRSEKPGAKSSNMKIVSNEEKHEEFPPRRSIRSRGAKWDSDDDQEISPKKIGQSVSENDDASDSSHTTPKRSSRRRSKEFSENVLANAIARKEKSYEAPTPPQRLSRRIKPTAKVLANKELRIGVESQNNARLGLQVDKSPEEGVRTRRSARPSTIADTLSGQHRKITKRTKEPVIEIDLDESQDSKSDGKSDKQSDNSVMKLKHLCELGLKAISPAQDDEAEAREDDDDGDGDAETVDDEIDDDSEVINKLLEEDTSETSDEEFFCTMGGSQSDQRKRRSTRLQPSFGANDSDQSSPTPGDDDQKTPPRRSSRLTGPKHDYMHSIDDDLNYVPRRKRARTEEVQSEVEAEDNSNPAAGEDGTEAACPSDESRVVAKCYCQQPSNIFAAPSELTEPVFCQAIEMVDGVRVGCSHGARKDEDGSYAALLRAGPRAPYFMACKLHAMQLAKHMCCPACGLFCTQGVFYQCSEGHLFHAECGLPLSDTKQCTGCPHCGVHSYRWRAANGDCAKVKVQMHCSNKRIFLPDQREQCTPSYLGFSTLKPSQLDLGPVIPEDLLPSPPIDLKRLCQKSEKPEESDTLDSSAEQIVYDAIVAGETAEQLIPKIVAMRDVNKLLESGSSCVHCAAERGHLAALYLLQYAGADLDLFSVATHTPLMLAVLALVDKAEKKSPKSKKRKESPEKDVAGETEADQTKEVVEDEKESKEPVEELNLEKKEAERPKDEDLMKVIRYLVAAGCDVNLSGPEGMTALHMSSQHGSAWACATLLDGSVAHVDPRDHGGWTPLVWATENSHYDVVKSLIGYGADPCTVDKEGNGAVHWCALSGDRRCLLLLLHNAPHALDALNAHSDTPLHVAARQGHYGCVVVLLARGARTDVENSAGELAVEVCSGECQSAISLNMQMALSCDKPTRYRLLSSDISNGREKYPIPCVNEVDDATLPDDFTYVVHHVTPSRISIDNTLETMQGCTCTEGSCSETSCSCCVLGVRKWFVRGRLLPSFPYHDPPMLFECNQTCGCNAKRCSNMVISRASRSASLLARAQVFRCGGATGWGLRAAQRVLRGAPVALYSGELLELADADARSADQYMFALDLKQDLLEQCAEKTLLCVDAAKYGSAARFINHSCRPNLAPVRVFTTTRDLRLPTIVLFAVRDIASGEQFTFDYGDKFWSVKSKWMKCECNTIECRYPVKCNDDEEL